MRQLPLSSRLTICAIAMTASATAQLAGSTQVRADDDNDKLPLYLSRTVDPVARDTSNPNQIWQGSGNPIHSFMVKRNLDAGIELA